MCCESSESKGSRTLDVPCSQHGMRSTVYWSLPNQASGIGFGGLYRLPWLLLYVRSSTAGLWLQLVYAARSRLGFLLCLALCDLFAGIGSARGTHGVR